VELGARHILLAVIAGFVVWSFYALFICLTIVLAVSMVLVVVVLRMMRDRPASGMEGGTPSVEWTDVPVKTDLHMAAAVVVVFLVTAGVLVGGSNYMYELDSAVDYSYEVTIEPSSNDTFTVICPVPCKADGTVCEEFLDEVAIIEGVGYISRTETEHGSAISILASGTVRIEWTDSWSIDGARYPNMTMTCEIDPYYDGEYPEVTAESWIYSNMNGTRVHLDYSMWAHSAGPGMFNPASGPYYEFDIVTDGRGWDTAGVEYYYEYAN